MTLAEVKILEMVKAMSEEEMSLAIKAMPLSILLEEVGNRFKEIAEKEIMIKWK